MAARKSLLPILFLFVAINGFAVVFRERLEEKHFDVDLLIIANLGLVGLTLASFYLLYRGMKASKTAGFLKSVYGSFLLKLVLLAGSVFAYVMINRETVNKASLITAMFLYLIYTFVETRSLLKLFREQQHA